MRALTVIIIFLSAVYLCRAERRLELTTIILAKQDGKELDIIQNIIDNNYLNKVEVVHFKNTNTISLFTQHTEHKVHIIEALKRSANIADADIKTERLPEVKITDSYHRHRRSASEFDVNAFNNLDSIMKYLDDLKTSYGSYVKVHHIGNTYQNRTIKLVEITSNSKIDKPKIFMDGGQHAREWISPAVILYMINELLNAIKDPSHHLRPVIAKYDFHLIPILNPDGYEFTYLPEGERFWRKNRKFTGKPDCVGVDLNRNYNFHWAESGSSADACSPVYHGQTAASEEETTAVSNYIMKQAGWHSFFSLHSFGQMILFPYSHTNAFGPDFHKHRNAGLQLAAGIKELRGLHYSTGAVGIILYRAAGSAESWAYAMAGFPYAYIIELPDMRSFILPPKEISPISREWISGIKRYLSHIEATEPKLNENLVKKISQQNTSGNSTNITTPSTVSTTSANPSTTSISSSATTATTTTTTTATTATTTATTTTTTTTTITVTATTTTKSSNDANTVSKSLRTRWNTLKFQKPAVTTDGLRIKENVATIKPANRAKDGKTPQVTPTKPHTSSASSQFAQNTVIALPILFTVYYTLL